MASSHTLGTSGSSAPWFPGNNGDLDWSTPLSFLDHLDSGDEDVEVTKNITDPRFDPVVGGRNSTPRSSSSRSSGSTGFYEAVELSPANSMSPQHFEIQEKQPHDDLSALQNVMTKMYISTTEPQHYQQNDLTHANTTLMKNLAALAQLNNTGDGGAIQKSPAVFFGGRGNGPPAVSQFLHNQQPSTPFGGVQVASKPASRPPPALTSSPTFESFSTLDSNNVFSPLQMKNSNNVVQSNNWQQMEIMPMQIRCKFGNLGQNQTQFHSPHGFCMGINEEIVVADTYNHRIQVFTKDGQFKFAFGMPGKEEGKLWYPRKIAVLKDSGNFVVCDRGNERSRMQIFSRMGHYVRRIQIRFIDIVAGLAIDRFNRIVAVDSVTPTIFILSEDGTLLKYIECAEYMSEPSDIAIFGKEYYICDFKGHGIVVIHEDGKFMRRIGDRPVTNFPNGIDISDEGDILVGDSHGNQFHVAIYDRMGVLVSQYQCPQVKVSRCCGLKITSEGFIVTLAKNNHHVLVLNTLFVP